MGLKIKNKMNSLNPNIQHYRMFIQQTKRFLVYLPNYFLFLSWRCGSLSGGGNDEHALNLASGWEINIFDDFYSCSCSSCHYQFSPGGVGFWINYPGLLCSDNRPDIAAFSRGGNESFRSFTVPREGPYYIDWKCPLVLSQLRICYRGCSQMTSAFFGVSDTPWCLCQPIISFWHAPWCFKLTTSAQTQNDHF